VSLPVIFTTGVPCMRGGRQRRVELLGDADVEQHRMIAADDVRSPA
jgi:hypothetical protein